MNALTQHQKKMAILNREKARFEIRLKRDGWFEVYQDGVLKESGWCRDARKEAKKAVDRLAYQSLGW